MDHIISSLATERESQLDMLREGSDLLWFPFTQYGTKPLHSAGVEDSTSGRPEVNFIESAYDDDFRVLKIRQNASAQAGLGGAFADKGSSGDTMGVGVGHVSEVSLQTEELHDGSASWWTQVWGPRLTRTGAVARMIGDVSASV